MPVFTQRIKSIKHQPSAVIKSPPSHDLIVIDGTTMLPSNPDSPLGLHTMRWL